jgi:diguanylate cyclase (GGDEF)-like protein
MKVLIADDDAVSRRMLEALVRKWGYEVSTAGDGAAAWEKLQEEDSPRLALLDWMMPYKDGLEICRGLRERRDEPYVYTLLLTSKDQKQDVLEGLDAGADDYLVKPVDTDELEARLRCGKRILELQEQLVSAREALRYQATHDPVTKLWNRAAILESLDRELDRSWRHGTQVGVVMADLDHFKTVNDTYGHLMGDFALRESARRMSSMIRKYDSLGRYGGEEFVLVVPECDAHMTFDQAERLRECIARDPMVAPECSIHLTASFGVSTSGVGQRIEATALIRAADEALYRAKEQGRNRVELALEDAEVHS